MTSYEHVRGSSPARSEHRKMSFNPVGTWVPPPAQQKPIAAHEITKAERIAQVCAAVIYCLFSAGVVFGYAALKPVLLDEGVYSEVCADISQSSYTIEKSSKRCYGQELKLNLMFTVAAVATNVCALPVGTVLDKYGPRVSGIIGSILLAIGAVFLAAASRLPFDGYIPGYLFLALGGPFVFISSFQLSNAFPRNSGFILALLTGAFDSSSAVFLIYRLIYNATGGVFTPQKFFLAYLIVPLYILVVQIFLMPKKSYKTVGELVQQAEAPKIDDDSVASEDLGSEEATHMRQERQRRHEDMVTEVTSLLGNKSGHQQKKEVEKQQKSGVFGALHGRSAWEQIRTPWFILITLFTVIQMTRINYFVATVRSQYRYMLHSDAQAEKVNNVFDVGLPAGGVLAIPFIGLILDNTSTITTLSVLVVTATIIGVLGLLPYMWAAYANIAIFVLYRPFYYTAVSDYAAKVFGFHTFGKVYGLIICLAGILNFIQSALDAWTHTTFHGNPIPVNLMLLFVAFLVGFSLVAYVWYKSRHIAQDQLEDETEGATEVEGPFADQG